MKKGTHHTKEANEKNRQAHLGKKATEETKRKLRGHIPWNKETKGVIKSNKTSFKKGHNTWNKGKKGLQIAWNKGKKWSEYMSKEGAQKSLANIPLIPWNKGKKGVQVSWNKGIIGKDSHSWLGGTSCKPYSSEWTVGLRQSIRERDNYVCQLSGKYGDCVHHIDYNKKNCDPKNLITLSRRCNSIVNFNRKYWTNYFRDKIWITN